MQASARHRADRARRGFAAWKTLGFLVLASLVAGVFLLKSHRTLLDDRAIVQKHWSEVVRQYERRTDVVTKLLGTARESRVPEASLGPLSEAHHRIDRGNPPESIYSERKKIGAYLRGQDELEKALGPFLNYVEERDALDGQAFDEVRASLDHTEKRIEVAWRDHAAAIDRHDADMSRFPMTLIVRLTGLQRLPQLSPDRRPAGVAQVDGDQD